jgi:hypothetical protein
MPEIGRVRGWQEAVEAIEDGRMPVLGGPMRWAAACSAQEGFEEGRQAAG